MPTLIDFYKTMNAIVHRVKCWQTNTMNPLKMHKKLSGPAKKPFNIRGKRRNKRRFIGYRIFARRAKKNASGYLPG